MLTIISGLAAGAAHVVSGPDHLAALAPIAVDQPRRALAIGARWGLGHGAGVVLLGSLGILARGVIDIDVASAWAEFSVGFVLIGVGAWALHRSRAVVIHTHGHTHEHCHDDEKSAHAHERDDETSAANATDAAGSAHELHLAADRTHTHAHSHVHVHAVTEDHEAPGAHATHGRTAFFVGLLHGAAGGGHLLGVLPSLALPREAAVVYLGAYFLAAVAAMAGFGAALGMIVRRAGPAMVQRLMTASSLVAIVVGVTWLATAWPA